MSSEPIVPETAPKGPKTLAALVAAVLTVVLVAGVALAFALAPSPDATVTPPRSPRLEPGERFDESLFPEVVPLRPASGLVEFTVDDVWVGECADLGSGTAELVSDGCEYRIEGVYVGGDYLVSFALYAYADSARAREVRNAIADEVVDLDELRPNARFEQSGWHYWTVHGVNGYVVLARCGLAEPAQSEEELPEETFDVADAFATWLGLEIRTRTG